MARADFYLIQKERFREDPLLLVCELAKRGYAANLPMLVLARDTAQAEALVSAADRVCPYSELARNGAAVLLRLAHD